MKDFFKIKARDFLTLFLLCGGALLAWHIVYPSGTWRYKMTVVVETPEGIKTGTAVREVRYVTGPNILPEAPGSRASLSKGEAVVVDLGARGTLFALMRGGRYGADYGHYIVFSAFPPPKGTVILSREGISYYSSLAGTKVILRPDQYPMFVRFRDPKDPKTVESLLDMKPCLDTKTGVPEGTLCLVKDHFEEAFGEGVKLKEVTVEMTDEKVTRGLVQRLSWLSRYYAQMLDGKRYNTYGSKLPFANSLNAGDFSTEESPYGH